MPVIRRTAGAVSLLALAVAQACSSSPARPGSVDPDALGGTSGASAGRSSSSGGRAAAGRASGGADSDASGAAGTSGEAGTSGDANVDNAGSADAGSSGLAAGAAGDPDSAGTAGMATGGSAAGGQGGNGPGPAPLCAGNASWVDGPALAISTPSDDRLGSVSADELSLAFTATSNDVVTVFYADRESLLVPFAEPKQVSGAFALDRAALSPDGLVLVLVNADRRGFSEYTRSTRADAFQAGATDFAAFDYYAESVMPPGDSFGDPLLALDDKTFLYSEYGAGVSGTVHQSKRLFSGDIWTPGSIIDESELAAVDGQRRRPTGLSADGRTLFFWDEAQSQERAGFFVFQGNHFSNVVDLGPLSNATPSADCKRLYHSAPGSLSLDLFVASAP